MHKVSYGVVNALNGFVGENSVKTVALKLHCIIVKFRNVAAIHELCLHLIK